LKIKDILQQKRTVSFEFFPPREADAVPGVVDVIKGLSRYNPDFVSVTYGAGGSTRAFTEEITVQLASETSLEVMAHLTCVAQSQDEVHGVLSRLGHAGIENVIALRGDRPPDMDADAVFPGEFSHATDLIRHIRQHFDMGIAGACYPEGHTESQDLATDLQYARMKQDLGADFLITQLFYDNSHYYDLLERAEKTGIEVPIVPGVLPILSTPQIRRFTTLCGATIPDDLDQKLERFADDNRAVREIGVEHATRQVQDLWANGVPGVHFYVLNRSYSISRILQELRLDGHC
jgi:methylenetetrahydrofolate reductase (NADPH)